MDIQELKNHILNYDLVPTILESLGCHHIKKHENYYSCANPDGDNQGSVNVSTSTLGVVNYTRDLDTVSPYHDIFTLVQFYQGCNFFSAVQYICNRLGLSVYHDFNEGLPESIALSKMLVEMIDSDAQVEPDKPLKPISEKILSYYIQCVNDQFLSDNITYNTQQLFELGYDPYSNRITIPIRNYDGKLLGVKGRWFGEIPEGSDLQKYIYLEPCSKGRVLFGLDKSCDEIERNRTVYVGESEKFVMQLFSYGDMNCVSTGGKTISRHQIDLLSRLCDKVVLCFDKDVGVDELKNIADKFIEYIEVWAMVDEDGLLGKKESPSDDPEKWEKMKECLIKVR